MITITGCNKKKELSININLDLDDKIYMISYEYYINNKVSGGSSITKSNFKQLGSSVNFKIKSRSPYKIKENDKIKFKFYLTKDIDKAKSSNIILEDNLSTNITEELIIDFNKEYNFKISENSNKKLEVVYLNN
ncbi:hypothetical protein ABGF38_07100 [Helcococcus ovis]